MIVHVKITIKYILSSAITFTAWGHGAKGYGHVVEVWEILVRDTMARDGYERYKIHRSQSYRYPICTVSFVNGSRWQNSGARYLLDLYFCRGQDL